MVFRGRGEGESHRQQSNDCQLTADGGGGGRVIEILKSLMGASGKFYHMTQPRIFPKEI